MNLNEILYELFKNALPTDSELRNWKFILLLFILYYDVYCNKYNITYIQTDVCTIIDFLHETIVIWFRYWCWIHKIKNNNNHIIALAYIGLKDLEEVIRKSFMKHSIRLKFVSELL